MSHTVAPNSLPVFYGTNYFFWKIRMRTYFKSINVWHIIESGWTLPDTEITKWTTEEKSVATANGKALNAIFISVSDEEFSRMSRCEIAKQAWETLEITHEGTKVVRASKLLMLVSQFEAIRMLEDETFDEFYSKLSVIRNSTINLGKKMDDAKVVKKILRSLPERFIPQVAAVQQSNDLDAMRVEELVGFLQTFEQILSKHQKTKNIALKAKNIKVNLCGSSDEDNGDDKEIAMFAKKFKKIFRPMNGKFRNRDSKVHVKSKGNLREKVETSQRDKLSNERKCHECGGWGHIRIECANLKKSKGKGKAFNVTQSDESDDANSEEEVERKVNYLAFTASYDNDYKIDLPHMLNNPEKESDEKEFDDEVDLQIAYNDLFVECDKLNKQNKKKFKKS
jgi:hypothetical protein